MSETTLVQKSPRQVLWLRLIPFFLSASLFLSGLFSVFSPLPLVILGLTQNLFWVIGASLVNAVLIYLTKGPSHFQFYVFGVATLGLLIPYFLRYRKWTLERTTAGIWIAQIAIVLLVFWFYANQHGVGLFQEMKTVAVKHLDEVMAGMSSEGQKLILGEFSLEEWTTRMLIELPSSLAITLLVGAWINLYLAVSIYPGKTMLTRGIDRKAFKRWKTAEWLVWPTIAIWGAMLLTQGLVSDALMGAFKVMLTVYAIQGLAVLSAIFDAWRIQGFFRIFVLMLILFVMLPLLLGIGFFDQWFDFRSKIRQSS